MGETKVTSPNHFQFFPSSQLKGVWIRRGMGAGREEVARWQKKIKVKIDFLEKHNK